MGGVGKCTPWPRPPLTCTGYSPGYSSSLPPHPIQPKSGALFFLVFPFLAHTSETENSIQTTPLHRVLSRSSTLTTADAWSFTFTPPSAI